MRLCEPAYCLDAGAGDKNEIFWAGSEGESSTGRLEISRLDTARAEAVVGDGRVEGTNRYSGHKIS